MTSPVRSYALRLTLLSALLVLAAALALSVGSSGGSVREAVEVLLGGGDTTLRTIVLEIRLPRILLAGLVGGSLSLSGAVLQALLRNPLAEPWVLGLSGGAAVGAVLVVVLGWTVVGSWVGVLGPFLGALLAIGLVLQIALRVGPSLNPRVLILAGIVVAAFFNALILLLLTFADAESFRSAVLWIMGNLSGANRESVLLLALYLIPPVAVLLALARSFNLLALGEETALYLGTNVERVKRMGYLMTSLVVAAAVSVSGVIGFVGLIVPHGVRLVWGNEHRFLLPASFLAGGTFLILTDTVARTVIAPAELPTGVVTALLGVPLFVLLLIRGGQSMTEGRDG